MDSYLTGFESYALSNKWDPSMWASYLSALLKGRALEVFVRLSRDVQSDYGQIKEALLTNFDLTERSFRKKFRDCRPEKAKTFRQFSGRLASYLDKWLGLAKVEKIGILVAVTSVTIIMTTITGPTIRSIFVKLKVRM